MKSPHARPATRPIMPLPKRAPAWPCQCCPHAPPGQHRRRRGCPAGCAPSRRPTAMTCAPSTTMSRLGRGLAVGMDREAVGQGRDCSGPSLHQTCQAVHTWTFPYAQLGSRLTARATPGRLASTFDAHPEHSHRLPPHAPPAPGRACGWAGRQRALRRGGILITGAHLAAPHGGGGGHCGWVRALGMGRLLEGLVSVCGALGALVGGAAATAATACTGRHGTLLLQAVAGELLRCVLAFKWAGPGS